MSDRADRFRRLRSARGEARAGTDATQPRAETADLFEHFGVQVGPGTPPGATSHAVEGAPCRRCGWLLAYRRGETSCPMCGDPDPLSPVEAATR